MINPTQPSLITVPASPQFTMAVVMGCLDALRAAHHLTDWTLCDWNTGSEKGGSCPADKGSLKDTHVIRKTVRHIQMTSKTVKFMMEFAVYICANRPKISASARMSPSPSVVSR
jgi:transcriptional regulator GlxA family with amidase domain